jgi:hypothetical protein
MTSRQYIVLFLCGILIFCGLALIESSPGYMDADYYYAGGLRIAKDFTWREPFIWNYLGDPQGLPHPAFTYWMPLAGIVGAIGIKISGMVSFWGARIGFLIFAGCIGPLTAYLAYTFNPHRWAANFAGFLGIFAGFYCAYLPTTETFGIYMVLGGVFFILVMRLQDDRIFTEKDASNAVNDAGGNLTRTLALISPAWIYLSVGVVVGLMYMTRTDGLIWLIMAVIVIFVQYFSIRRMDNKRGISVFQFFPAVIICLFGFFIVCSPWILRNISEFGSVFAPGSSKAFWLTDYDDLFAYPASILTFQRWLSSGIGEIVKARAWALGLNLQSALAVQGGIFLLPLMLSGMWVKRKDWRVGIGILTWSAIFLTMTLVFPFQGARGGFFHAGAALQPLLWALVPVGLSAFISWGERLRKWNPQKSLKIFVYGSMGLVILITLFVTWRRLGVNVINGPVWGKTARNYLTVEKQLVKHGASPESIVMVNNPPGYNAATGRMSIVIPNGDLQTSIQAGKKYGAGYLVLDENYPDGLKDVFQNPGDQPGLINLGTINQIQIYMFEQ